MGDPVTFLVAGAPRSQGSHRAAVTRAGAPYLLESNAAVLRPWRKAVKAAAVEAMAGRMAFAGPVGIVLTFAVRHPASHQGRASWPIAKNIGDLDKFVRAALDAITGPVLVDDSQIVSLTARKVWALVDVDWPQGLHVWANNVPGYSPAPT